MNPFQGYYHSKSKNKPTLVYSTVPAGSSLDDLIDDVHCMGLQRFNQVIMASKPDTTRGHSLKMVSAKHIPSSAL
jgi:hypothetical protein